MSLRKHRVAEPLELDGDSISKMIIEERKHLSCSADMPTLEILLNGVTPDNIHQEIPIGADKGKEVQKIDRHTRPIMNDKPALFEDYQIRRVYDEHTETWYFSVVDIIRALLQQPDYQTARKYWNKLKERLNKEGSESVTNCHRLKLEAADGKKYLTDVASPEVLLRLIQSVPSPKAEPIKLWLARVGYERMQDMADPARSLDRAREYWRQHGRSEKWIQQRMMGQETRNKLTDYWKEHEIKKESEFAILTNIIHREWSGLTVQAHKKAKGLKAQNLRDHMSEAELIFTALAELSTRQIAEASEATGMKENKVASKKGGGIAKKARLELEKKTGRKVISKENYLPPNAGAIEGKKR